MIEEVKRRELNSTLANRSCARSLPRNSSPLSSRREERRNEGGRKIERRSRGTAECGRRLLPARNEARIQRGLGEEDCIGRGCYREWSFESPRSLRNKRKRRNHKAKSEGPYSVLFYENQSRALIN